MARQYRFFLRNPSSNFLKSKLQAKGDVFELTEKDEPDIFFQLTRVLRGKSGDTIILVPPQPEGQIFEYVFNVSDVQKRTITLTFEKRFENNNDLSFSLELILGLPNKPDKLDFILQKATEIGVKKIILVTADFTQLKHHLRPDRMQKIVIEAAEQSERAIVPEIIEAGPLKNFLQKLSTEEQQKIFVAMERLSSNTKKDDGSLVHLLSDYKEAKIQLLIGPEGGFSEEEKKLMAALNLTCFSLGKSVLRMETAAVIALGMTALLKS